MEMEFWFKVEDETFAEDQMVKAAFKR